MTDMNHCPLACRRQVLSLHHWARAGNTENTMSILWIYEKANGKESIKATKRSQVSLNSIEPRTSQERARVFQTGAHSECTSQRNRYAISKM